MSTHATIRPTHRVRIQHVREHWRAFGSAVTDDDLHVVITFSPGRLTDDPDIRPLAVAVPYHWWSAKLGRRKPDTESVSVYQLRPRLRTQVAQRVNQQRVHLIVTWHGDPGMVLMPPQDYARWAGTSVSTLLHGTEQIRSGA